MAADQIKYSRLEQKSVIRFLEAKPVKFLFLQFFVCLFVFFVFVLFFVFLFNGISTFVGYLISKQSLKKVCSGLI